ncbi:hypothetical protein PQO01_08815 [Lentisphaera marina]|uniref:hypothetical protein n=1 Tax=Lentisphaera marina TaxID=1111041 RepID=UPI00236737B9|nr:hypothetical protein [Lentisphaera marina]MDD7985047.1 hypothetical protein [Lentisphaera marina]
MIKLIILSMLCSTLFLSSCTSSDKHSTQDEKIIRALANTNTMTSLVTNNSAKFIIPIEHTDLITWNKKTTEDNHLEYDCQIRINNYDFGFSKFKYPGDEERTSSIIKLLEDGQASVWKRDQDGAEVIRSNNVQVTYQKPNIIIDITDPKTYKNIFMNKPKKYELSISGFKSKIKSKSAIITYKQQ